MTRQFTKNAQRLCEGGTTEAIQTTNKKMKDYSSLTEIGRDNFDSAWIASSLTHKSGIVPRNDVPHARHGFASGFNHIHFA